jgi:hypothetical protein
VVPPPPVAEPAVLERPHFVEGELKSFIFRPSSLRNFVGIRGGISAIPNDTSTLINAFFLEIEPQVDIVADKSSFRLGLGVPLRFELADTQGPVETCIDQAQATRMAGGNQEEVMLATGLCLSDKQSKVVENMGRLRKADWDEGSDYARVVRYLVIGKPESPFYFSASRQFDQSLGHGTVIRNYNPNINFNTARLGATLDLHQGPIGGQFLANDVIRPDVLGFLGFLRPLRPFSNGTVARSLSFGFSFVYGSNQPRTLALEPGLFGPAFNQPIPKVNDALGHEGLLSRGLSVLGGDIEVKLVRGETADVKLYADYQKMAGLGGGLSLGSLFRLSFGQPATQATRARFEVQRFDADYLPSYFDTFHDVFQYQYLPVAYTGSNTLTYYPTKLGFLEASKGGSTRYGYHAELTHTIFDLLTIGFAARGWRPSGNSRTLSFSDPSCLNPGTANPNCGGANVLINEPSFSALRLRVELPFRRFLQAFGAYEVFSTTAQKGLGIAKFQGDNEILFAGARLMILPILFLQAETRRYFFLQRVANVDLNNLTVTQDQNIHSNWTFAVGAYLGYEFN